MKKKEKKKKETEDSHNDCEAHTKRDAEKQILSRPIPEQFDDNHPG